MRARLCVCVRACVSAFRATDFQSPVSPPPPPPPPYPFASSLDGFASLTSDDDVYRGKKLSSQFLDRAAVEVSVPVRPHGPITGAEVLRFLLNLASSVGGCLLEVSRASVWR